MKKFFTFSLALMLGMAAAQAQEATERFKFVYADGTEVPNGSTIHVTNYHTMDPFTGSAVMASGLYVVNTTSEPQTLSVEINVKSLPNGEIQLCFPMNCQNYSLGKKETQKGVMKSGQTNDLQTEWMASAYGTSTVTYTLKNYNFVGTVGGVDQYDLVGEGPTVTVVYEYSENSISGISDVKVGSEAKAGYYDLQGRKVSAPTKGLYIVNDGKESKKVILK